MTLIIGILCSDGIVMGARLFQDLSNLTAEEAQAFADVFSNIAKRLKTPGK